MSGILILDELFAEHPFLLTAIWLVIIAAVAIAFERIASRWIRGFIAKRDMPLHAGNALLLTARVIILVGTLIAVLRVGGVSSDIIVAFSALGGAAIGFASSQTIGNIVAGLYILISHPFRAGDYVRMDGVEGIVKEISINYTKILTMAGNVVWTSNRRILDKDIVNFRYMDEDASLFRYGLRIGFDHSLPSEKIVEILDKMVESYAEEMPKMPEYDLVELTNFSRTYVFYIYVEDPRDVFMLQPRILKDIIELRDRERKELQ
jgi:small conductance mechanosensitive channel